MTTQRAGDSPADDVRVDPRAPRFGQAITSAALLAGVAFQIPATVYAVASILGLAVATGWRVDVYGTVWRFLQTAVGPPHEPEPAGPHRFATLVGAVGTSVASGLLLAGAPVAGYAVAAVVATAAGLAATTGICLGCRFYRQVGYVRRLGVV